MRNIVICCDGTGNEISENISNVLKLYRCLHKKETATPRQIVYYDPGVGTLAQPETWHWIRQNLNLVLGLAFGYGLDGDVLAAYAFLVNNYQDGDRIYLFGFSRGAYTVRVLAGLIHKVGLISPPQVNLAGSGLIAYKRFSSDVAPKFAFDLRALTDAGADEDGPLPITRFDNAAQFARITSSRWPTIHFVGVWDTVASVFVPRRDRFYLPSVEQLAFTERNPSVKIFRQAISIDERRRLFRLKRWDERQDYAANPFHQTGTEPQDIRQVWFAGVHADIGGGYPERDSALSKYPLIWMIDEAVKSGLTVKPKTMRHLAWGEVKPGSPFFYVPPDPAGKLHDSMTPAWRLLEFFPKRARHREWPERTTFAGVYIPDAEPRFIPAGAFIHESVLKRIDLVEDYRPVNLPAHYRTVPMPTPPPSASAADAAMTEGHAEGEADTRRVG